MTYFSHIKEDARKDIETLEREADHARAEVERTLEAIERRLSPTELIHHATDAVRANGGDFARNLATQVRNNPMPAVLAGIGIAWLMTASDRPPRRRVSHETGPSVGERVSSAAARTRGASRHAADNVRSAARGTAGAARGIAGATRGAAGDIAGTASGAAGRVAGASRAGAHNLHDGYDYLRREQPLVLGALAVAAGALIGTMIPRTAAEDDWIGETSDEARERIRREGRRSVEEAKAAAADVAEAATGAVTEAVQTRRRPAESPPAQPGAPPTQ